MVKNNMHDEERQEGSDKWVVTDFHRLEFILENVFVFSGMKKDGR